MLRFKDVMLKKLGETVKMCVFEWLSYTNDQHGEKNKLQHMYLHRSAHSVFVSRPSCSVNLIRPPLNITPSNGKVAIRKDQTL